MVDGVLQVVRKGINMCESLPPCSCCRKEPERIEFYTQLEISKQPTRYHSVKRNIFLCPSCSEKLLKGLTVYDLQMKEEWIPQ